MPSLAEHPRGVTIDIVAQPRASRTEIARADVDAIRIRVAAPPVDGAANTALIEFLSDTLGVSRTRISILRGVRDRRKTILVEGLSPADARVRLGIETV